MMSSYFPWYLKYKKVDNITVVKKLLEETRKSRKYNEQLCFIVWRSVLEILLTFNQQ